MYIAEKLEKINKQIADENQKYETVVASIKDLYEQNKDYLQNYIDGYRIENIEELAKSKDKNDQSLVSLGTIGSIYHYLDELKKNILNLKKQRDEFIDQVLTNSMFSVKEVIWILDQYGIYYKNMNYGGKTLLVPQDLVLLNKVENGEDIDNKVKRIKNGENLLIHAIGKYRKDIDVTATLNENIKSFSNGSEILTNGDVFVKDENGFKVNGNALSKVFTSTLNNIMGNLKEMIDKKEIKLVYKTSINDSLLDLAPAMVVNDLAGIHFYLPTKDGNIKLNEQVLNVFPEEVLGFILEFIEEKTIDKNLKLKDYYDKQELLKR